MTQQDETGQGAVTDQSVPSRPSPYLDAGESVPEAYLAPPQPGQPRFGSAPPYRPGLRSRGPAQQPYTQPGYGQPGYGQPGSRQPGSRPFGAAQARRDPALAAPWERLAASVLDWLIIYIISVLAFWSPLIRVAREIRAIMVSTQGQNSPAAQAAIDNLLSDPSTRHVLLWWSLAVFAIALAYYWIQHAAWGATIGKRAVGVRVVQADDHARISVRAAGIRAVTFLVGPAVLWLLAPPFSIVGGVLWAADAGMVLLDPRAQCLHDKLASTIVIRKRWLNRQAGSTSPR